MLERVSYSDKTGFFSQSEHAFDCYKVTLRSKGHLDVSNAAVVEDGLR
jgi:hypothetical protein